MQLSREATEEFRALYREEFGHEISDEQARAMGEKLVDLFRVIYRPMQEEVPNATKDQVSGPAKMLERRRVGNRHYQTDKSANFDCGPGTNVG